MGKMLYLRVCVFFTIAGNEVCLAVLFLFKNIVIVLMMLACGCRKRLGQQTACNQFVEDKYIRIFLYQAPQVSKRAYDIRPFAHKFICFIFILLFGLYDQRGWQ